jgi:hypothetical protein
VTIQWNIWWGNNASTWKLYEKAPGASEALIETGTLTENSPNAQTATINLTGRGAGTYTYRIWVTNAAGLSNQNSATVLVGNSGVPAPTSPISITPGDSSQGQVYQLSVNLNASTQFQLAEASLTQFNYRLIVSNPTLLKTASIDGAGILTINGAQPGQTSIRIINDASGAARNIGILVKNSDGSIPGMPGYLAIGSVSQDDDGAVKFWQDISSDGKNKRMDIRYIYLNNGPGPLGWHTWGNGQRVSTFVKNSLSFGMIPYFVYYNINNGEDNLGTIMKNIADPSFMGLYFQDLKLAVTQAKEAAGDSWVGFLMEPDFLGYVLQNNVNADPTQMSAQVNAAYTSGVLTQGVDPAFPNTLTGLVQCMNYIVGKYNSKAYVGWQLNLWSNPVNSGGSGIIRATDTLGFAAGQQAIRANAQGLMQFAMKAGIGYQADFISIDKYGLDAGAQVGAAAQPASSIWFWNADHWNNYLLFASVLHQVSHLPVVLWQLPVGHINNTTGVNPYTSSSFAVLGNNTGTFEDSAPTYFFGDVFSNSTSVRSNQYFASNLGLDPKISTSSSQITWGSHFDSAASAGVVAILFGAGVGMSTQGTPSPSNVDISKPTDDYWWITKVQGYYQHVASVLSRMRGQ